MIDTLEKNWYTVKVQNNREKSVSEKLKSDMIREFSEEINVLIPSQNISTLKGGKIKHKEQIMYPGYIFVETSSIDKVLHFTKVINGMTSVLKDPQGNPIVLRKSEIERMTGEVKERNSVGKDLYAINEEVKIIEGPFSTFVAKIQSIDYEKDKVRVEVSIFGRATIVDLTLSGISK
jgi:transcriptional antiterminator NusG